MKKIFLTLATIALCFFLANAQAPLKFNYQGAARTNTGVPIVNQSISLRISILDLTSSGTVVYSETQTTITNAFGLFNVAIGAGTVVTGTMSGINWAAGDKYMKVEMDPAGGTAYVALGTAQLLANPYSLRAEDAGRVMIYGSGTSNPDKMVIQHSPAWPTFGLQYDDLTDKFHFVSAGTPVLSVDLGYLRVGIGTGTVTPVSALEVKGTVTIAGTNTSELNRTQTSDANLVPIAYGNINADGTINLTSTTSNVTLQSHTVGSGNYYFTIASETVAYLDYTAIVSLNGSPNGFISWNSASGALYVGTTNISGAMTDHAFTFVLYKK